MIVRAVVAVVLALALLAASLPGIERARVEHSDARVIGEVERLERVATSLVVENDAVTDGGPPARTRLTLHLPRRSWGDSGLSEFRIPESTGETDVRWTVSGGTEQHRTLDDVALTGPDDGLVLRTGGRHRLVLERTRESGNRSVLVRRPAPGGTNPG